MKTLLLIIFTVFIALPNAYGDIAGLVLLAKGNTFATNQQGIKRPLKRRSKILEGDTLSTGKNSKLQIRFVDKALLTLKENSKLNISVYQLVKKENGEQKVVMDLITGGFRTITGSIGKGEKAHTLLTRQPPVSVFAGQIMKSHKKKAVNLS